MKLGEFSEHLESRLKSHLHEVSKRAAQVIQQTTPSDRKKTRAAVRVEITADRGTVALKFRTKYETRGTPTLRRLESQWRTLRPQIRKELIRRINDTLKGN